MVSASLQEWETSSFKFSARGHVTGGWIDFQGGGNVPGAQVVVPLDAEEASVAAAFQAISGGTGPAPASGSGLGSGARGPLPKLE